MFPLIAGLFVLLGGYYLYTKEKTPATAVGPTGAAGSTVAKTAALSATSTASNPILQLIAGQGISLVNNKQTVPLSYSPPLDGYGMTINTSNSDTMNAVLFYMKRNPSSHAPIPAPAANWLVAHGIDPTRTGA